LIDRRIIEAHRGVDMEELVRLTAALLDHGQTDALRDGTVRPRGIELEHIDVKPPPMIYRRQVRNLEFDVAELAITTFLCARAFGKPISALPVFSNRDLQLSPILVNSRSDIQGPKDFEGKRVGMRSFTVSNNTQTRALLQSEFGLDTDRVTWVVTEDAHVAEFKDPPNVEYATTGKTLEEMLRAGEIDVGIQLSMQPEGDIRPLFTEEEGNDVALRFYRRTGIYPIGHIMTVKDETLAAHPWIGESLFEAFKVSKRRYLEDLPNRTTLNARDRQSLRNQEIVGGDPLPYGLPANRTSLEGMIQMTAAQRVIPGPLDVDPLFAPGTQSLE
jgi:4,5-dihydroxyphthalate decarboxylase